MPKCLALLTLALFAVGCGTGGGSSSVYCSFDVAGVTSCLGYLGLTGPQRDSEKITCEGEEGTVGDSCPSGYLGCCSTAGDGGAAYTSATCYYAGTASNLEASCMSSGGSWSTSDGSK